MTDFQGYNISMGVVELDCKASRSGPLRVSLSKALGKDCVSK